MAKKPKAQKRIRRRKPGRPEKKITAASLKKAEKAAEAGASYKEIAASLGLGYSTFFEKKNEYPELIEAIDRGVAKSIIAVRSKLLVNATTPALGQYGPVGPPGGSVEAQKFFLQSRAGDKVNNSLEVKGDESAPLAVRIILPSNERKNDGT